MMSTEGSLFAVPGLCRNWEHEQGSYPISCHIGGCCTYLALSRLTSRHTMTCRHAGPTPTIPAATHSAAAPTPASGSSPAVPAVPAHPGIATILAAAVATDSRAAAVARYKSLAEGADEIQADNAKRLCTECGTEMKMAIWCLSGQVCEGPSLGSMAHCQ